MIYKLLFLIIIIYLIYFTPQIISDYIWGLFCKNIIIIYLENNKNLLRFNFHHKKFDGKLIEYFIKNNKIKKSIENNIQINKFKPFQYLYNKKILNYSKFISSNSYLIKEMLNYQNRKLNICILVSLRDKLNNKIQFGNYIKFACFTVTPVDDIYNICYKQDKAINKVRNKKYIKKNTTLYDFYKLSNIDYIFNSWRNLTLINTIDNNILLRQSIIEISEDDIYDLKHNKSKSAITLDYLNNKYIISNIEKI